MCNQKYISPIYIDVFGFSITWCDNGEFGKWTRLTEKHIPYLITGGNLWEIWTFYNWKSLYFARWYIINWQTWWRHQNDDVIKLKRFPRYWPFVWVIHRPPVNSPHKGQWRGTLMFSLICASINGWVNNREAGELRRHRAHYDAIVMVEIGNEFIVTMQRVSVLV